MTKKDVLEEVIEILIKEAMESNSSLFKQKEKVNKYRLKA